MSQENVEVVRAALDASQRDDWDAALKDFAPDFVLDNSRDLGEWRGVHTTPGEARRVWERFTEPWESVHIQIDEVIEAGEHVVSRQTAVLTGRDGIEVKATVNWLWTLRDGAITHLVSYPTFEEALEAAGLER